jgi:hypothetical protein
MKWSGQVARIVSTKGLSINISNKNCVNENYQEYHTVLCIIAQRQKKGLRGENRAEAKSYYPILPHPPICFLRLILIRREINPTGRYVKALFLYYNVGSHRLHSFYEFPPSFQVNTGPPFTCVWYIIYESSYHSTLGYGQSYCVHRKINQQVRNNFFTRQV